MRWSDQPQIDVSIVVPALNEGPNLPVLMQRIAETMAGRSYEVLIVDDGSADDTLDVCSALRRQYPVQLFVRTKPENGLSGAVLFGLARAHGNLLLVMDADLQHPPEQIPDLLGPLERGEAEFVIGSRYVAGGS